MTKHNPIINKIRQVCRMDTAHNLTTNLPTKLLHLYPINHPHAGQGTVFLLHLDLFLYLRHQDLYQSHHTCQNHLDLPLLPRKHLLPTLTSHNSTLTLNLGIFLLCLTHQHL